MIIPKIGVASRLTKVMVHLTAYWMKFLLWVVLRDNRSEEPVMYVTYFRKYHYVQLQISDVSAVVSAMSATQSAPEQLQ